MSELRDRHAKVMGLNAPLFYEEPIEVERGDGVWLYDRHGTRYLDLYNNVPCVGHANPRVAAALAQQAGTLNVHSRYLHRGVVDYAERLADLHHDGLNSLILACSGTEAVEVAINMARSATGGQGLICTDATYHGNSTLCSALTKLPVGEERRGVRSIATPQLFRPLEPGLTEAQLLEWHLEQLRNTIAKLEHDGHRFAGLLLCSILANEGLPRPPHGWYQAMAEVVHRAGGLVIADEVQAGFGRSGSWWGYEANGFRPDIVTMGKPMGNGLPVSGVIADHGLVSSFRARHRYFNTFAASPLQAAAGMAVIDEIEERELIDQVRTVGLQLRAGLVELAHHDPRMGDVRGVGMFTGIDWVHPETTDPDVAGAAAMVEALKQRGMLLGKAGQHGNVLKIRPPLVFDRDNCTQFLDTFADALDGTGASS